jgi:hypothetical protein
MELQIERITISRGATINKGNYENERVDVSMTAIVHPEQAYSLVLVQLRGAVEMALRAEVERTLDALGEPGAWERRGWDARFGIEAEKKSVAVAALPGDDAAYDETEADEDYDDDAPDLDDEPDIEDGDSGIFDDDDAADDDTESDIEDDEDGASLVFSDPNYIPF